MQGSVESSEGRHNRQVALCEMNNATGARTQRRCMDGALGSIHRDTGKGRRSGDTVF